MEMGQFLPLIANARRAENTVDKVQSQRASKSEVDDLTHMPMVGTAGSRMKNLCVRNTSSCSEGSLTLQ